KIRSVDVHPPLVSLFHWSALPPKKYKKMIKASSAQIPTKVRTCRTRLFSPRCTPITVLIPLGPVLRRRRSGTLGILLTLKIIPIFYLSNIIVPSQGNVNAPPISPPSTGGNRGKNPAGAHDSPGLRFRRPLRPATRDPTLSPHR